MLRSKCKGLSQMISADLDIPDGGCCHQLDHPAPGPGLHVVLLGGLQHRGRQQLEAARPGRVVNTSLPHRHHGHHLQVNYRLHFKMEPVVLTIM